MQKSRRETLLRQANLLQMLKDFEGLNESQKLENVHVHILNIGTYTSDKLNAAYFDKLPPLDEISEDDNMRKIISK